MCKELGAIDFHSETNQAFSRLLRALLVAVIPYMVSIYGHRKEDMATVIVRCLLFSGGVSR